MAAVVCTFEPIRGKPRPPAPPDQANRPCQTRGPSPRTRTDFQGLSCDDAILISSDDSDDGFDDSQSDGGRGVDILAIDEDRLSLSDAARETHGTHAIIEALEGTSEANGSSMMEPAPSPTCESPGSALVSIRARSNTPTLGHDRPCNQHGDQGVEDAGGATPPEHSRCYDVDSNDDGPMEDPAVDSSPDPQESPAESATRPERDNDTGNESGRDHDNVDNAEDDDSQLHNFSTPLAEMEAAEARADTPDTECDTQSDSPAQLPSPSGYPSPPRSCSRGGRGFCRVGMPARGDRETGLPHRLQQRPRQDLECSRGQGDELVLDEDNEDDEGDGDCDPPLVDVMCGRFPHLPSLATPRRLRERVQRIQARLANYAGPYYPAFAQSMPLHWHWVKAVALSGPLSVSGTVVA